MSGSAFWSGGLILCHARGTSQPEERALAGVTDEGTGLAPGAFDAQFTRHAEDVRRVCLRLLGPAGAAEDAAHETFLRARRALDGYDARRAFRPWLLAIAANHCVDVLRRRQTERRLFSPEPEDALPLPAPGPSPLRGLLDAEARLQVLACVDAMPERYRAPLVLRYFADLDPETIAGILEISRAQVATLMYRGRRRLREQYRALAGEGA